MTEDGFNMTLIESYLTVNSAILISIPAYCENGIYAQNADHCYIQYTCSHVRMCSGMETASHAGHCLINLVNVRQSETKLYTKYMGSRPRVVKIGKNVL